MKAAMLNHEEINSARGEVAYRSSGDKYMKALVGAANIMYHPLGSIP